MLQNGKLSIILAIITFLKLLVCRYSGASLSRCAFPAISTCQQQSRTLTALPQTGAKAIAIPKKVCNSHFPKRRI